MSRSASPPPEPSSRESREDELCVHIFSVSAALVGVCLTVIGLFRVILRIRELDSIADNVLAVDALGFMVSCSLAYLGLRSRATARRRLLETLADRFFLASLGLMTVVCALIAYELI
jgi:multisubunit Na+/H+ antiporter MnhF subunit